jgi:CO dehydrogenase nickel-insertion accessory protein CooC1
LLFVGFDTANRDKRVEIDLDGLLHHTLIVGQSGGGKSFLVARIIEEILLRTMARVLIIDPNGDFRQICTVNTAIWNQQNQKKFDDLHQSSESKHTASFDTLELFSSGWRAIAESW